MFETSGLRVSIKEVQGARSLVFHKPEMRRGMQAIGRMIQKAAQMLVNGQATSKPGEYPARAAGRLSRSIRPQVSRSGFMVVIRPQRKADFGGKEFYPAFLHYGARYARNKGHAKHTTGAFRVQPRRNYMVDALEARQARAQQILLECVKKGVGFR